MIEYWRVGDGGRTIFGPPNGNPSPETIATVTKRCNAALIAAAPALLEALKGLVSSLEWEERRSGTTYSGYDSAREAIARAEGGSKTLSM
jgi:hypothetical protein